MKKKLISSNKEIDEFKHQVSQLKGRYLVFALFMQEGANQQPCDSVT